MPSPRFAIVLCFALLGITAPAAERPDDPGEHDFGRSRPPVSDGSGTFFF
jgi:hypothetical protein